VQQRVTTTGEKEEMVAITFAVCALCSLAMLAIEQKKNFPTVMKQTRRSLLLLAIASLVVAGAIHILTIIIGKIDLAVLYTFYNSAVLMLSVLCSYLFLKEKLSLKNVIGCITMCTALVFLMGGDAILAALH
jgi:drug/metabolite transporter (DMT)-like permease